MEFLKAALALLPEKHPLRVVRADAGFFDQQLLGFLEQCGLCYIVVALLTRWLKREAARVSQWRALDEHYAAGEFSLQLLGWDRPGRFVVIREQLRAERPSLGRKLLDVPGYTFRVFVTNLALPPEQIWRDYNRRHGKSHRRTETFLFASAVRSSALAARSLAFAISSRNASASLRAVSELALAILMSRSKALAVALADSGARFSRATSMSEMVCKWPENRRTPASANNSPKLPTKRPGKDNASLGVPS